MRTPTEAHRAWSEGLISTSEFITNLLHHLSEIHEALAAVQVDLSKSEPSGDDE